MTTLNNEAAEKIDKAKEQVKLSFDTVKQKADQLPKAQPKLVNAGRLLSAIFFFFLTLATVYSARDHEKSKQLTTLGALFGIITSTLVSLIVYPHIKAQAQQQKKHTTLDEKKLDKTNGAPIPPVK